MKIFHLITSLKIGGAESALINFLTAANNNPHEHVVAYFHPGPNLEKIHALNITTHHITGLISYTDPIGLWKLARLIKQEQPNIIHSALWSANIIGRLMAKYFSLPIICDIHGNSFDEGKFRNWFDRQTVGYATKIVAVSTSTHDTYHTNIIAQLKDPNLANNLITINNGIDCPSVCSRAQKHQLKRADFGLTDNDFVIGALGRLEPIKSYDILIKAFREVQEGTACGKNSHKKTTLMIVGGGSQEQTLKTLCSDLGISEKVIFVGYRTDAISFYPLFDCFVLSSQSEGLSIALLEALCFGLPIITTNQTPIHDVIEHNVNGLIVPTNNIQALAEAIKSLRENNDLRISMQKANKALVADRFSLKKTITSYHKIYTEKAVLFSDKNKTRL